MFLVFSFFMEIFQDMILYNNFYSQIVPSGFLLTVRIIE